MVVTTTAAMVDELRAKNLVINKTKATVEAGELTVPKGDAIIPSKLRLLAECGWSVQDVWKDSDGGFRLLLTRNVTADDRE